jgi:hypothetical protein
MARVQLIEFNEKQYQKSWWKWLLMIGTHSPNTLDETLTKLSKKGRIDG